MTPNEVPLSKLLPRLTLPSDQITLGVLRKANPELCSVEAIRSGSVCESAVLSLLKLELKLVAKLVARHTGGVDPYDTQLERIDALRGDIVSEYVALHVCAGTAEAHATLRRLEADVGRALGKTR